MPEESLEKLHADALAEVVAKIRAHPAVNVLVTPDHVFGPDAVSLGSAEEWARCVLVRAGENHGTPGGVIETRAARRDAVIEMRAENRESLGMLAAAVSKALHGAVGRIGFRQCLRLAGGLETPGPGTPPEYIARTEVFKLTCQFDPEPVRSMVAAPRMRVTKLTRPAIPRRAGRLTHQKADGEV